MWMGLAGPIAVVPAAMWMGLASPIAVLAAKWTALARPLAVVWVKKRVMNFSRYHNSKLRAFDPGHCVAMPNNPREEQMC